MKQWDEPMTGAEFHELVCSDPMKGIGGAPTRATTLPTEPQERKRYPVASGVLDYFPDALVALAALSWQGNEQHNPGQPLHWARGKSGDEADTLIRHFLQRGTRDTDGVRHSTKMVWRALAFLQKEIEAEQEVVVKPAALPSLHPVDFRDGTILDCYGGQNWRCKDMCQTAGRCVFAPVPDEHLG